MKAFRRCLDANIPCIIWGTDGEGKTSAVLAEAKKRGWHCFFLIGSNLDPTDIGGLPTIDSTSQVRRLPVALAIREAKRLGDAGEHVIIFLDEANTSPPAVQATMLTLVQEGMAGDVQLSKEFVHYVMAANPPEIAVNASDFQPPTCTRMVHLDWRLDNSTYKEGMLSGDWAPIGPASVVVAFMERFGWSHLRQPPTAEFINKPRCTPRTWTMAAKILEISDKAGDDRDTRHELIAGTIGHGAAAEFMGFLDMREHILPPDVILAQAETVAFPDRSDLSYLMFSAVGAHFLQNPTKENWSAVWTLLGRTENTPHFDKAALCARTVSGILSKPEGKHLRSMLPKQAAMFAGVYRELGVLSKKGGE